MKVILFIFTNLLVNTKELNSHQVNSSLDQHHNDLKTHYDNKIKYETNVSKIEKIHSDALLNVKKESLQEIELNKIKAKFNDLKTKNGNDFTNLMNEYNNLVDKYNDSKSNYCPDLIKLDNAKPLDPKSPEFYCESISRICSHYSAYMMLLLTIFDNNSDNFNNSDYINKNGVGCLYDKIFNHIVKDDKFPEDSNGKIDNVKVEMSFKAKCCFVSVNLTVIKHITKIKNIGDYSKLNINLFNLDNHPISYNTAKTDIDKAILQMKASINNQ